MFWYSESSRFARDSGVLMKHAQLADACPNVYSAATKQVVTRLRRNRDRTWGCPRRGRCRTVTHFQFLERDTSKSFLHVNRAPASGRTRARARRTLAVIWPTGQAYRPEAYRPAFGSRQAAVPPLGLPAPGGTVAAWRLPKAGR